MKKSNHNNQIVPRSAMPLAMVLLAVCVTRFPVAAEPQAGMAPDQQKRLEMMKSRTGGFADPPARASGGQTLGSRDRGGGLSSRTAGLAKH